MERGVSQRESKKTETEEAEEESRLAGKRKPEAATAMEEEQGWDRQKKV